jgi:MFS family permease
VFRINPLDSPRDTTYRMEKWRAVFNGVIEAAIATFLLLIAVRYYDAGPTAKSIISTGGALGLLLAPVAVVLVGMGRWPTTQAAAFLGMIGSTGFLVAGLYPTLPVFIGGSLLGVVMGAMAIPLWTQTYQDNYPSHERGKLFSRATVLRIVAAGVASELIGRYLGGGIGRFPQFMVFLALCGYMTSCLAARIPSRPLAREKGAHPLRSFHYLKEDRLLRWMLVSWMLMGLGNLMMIPLRVEYLANPIHGLTLSIPMIALLIGVLPNVSRLIFSLMWGRLFDRVDFLVLRICLNLGFLLGIATFFVGNSLIGLAVGSLLFGIAIAGGDVAWSLWVTKLARPDRVADYMGLHTFFTGVRGVAAPFIAFYLLEGMSIRHISFVAMGLILSATVILVVEIRQGSVMGSEGSA